MLEFFRPGKITFNLEDGYLWRRHFHDLKGCLALYKIIGGMHGCWWWSWWRWGVCSSRGYSWMSANDDPSAPHHGKEWPTRPPASPRPPRNDLVDQVRMTLAPQNADPTPSVSTADQLLPHRPNGRLIPLRAKNELYTPHPHCILGPPLPVHKTCSALWWLNFHSPRWSTIVSANWSELDHRPMRPYPPLWAVAVILHKSKRGEVISRGSQKVGCGHNFMN